MENGPEYPSPPLDARIRPTKEEVRDAWISQFEPDIGDAVILDLFAGTGALGLEALSRGARSVDFVENGPPALHAIKANLAKLRVKNRVENRARLFKKDVFLLPRDGPQSTRAPVRPGFRRPPLYVPGRGTVGDPLAGTALQPDLVHRACSGAKTPRQRKENPLRGYHRHDIPDPDQEPGILGSPDASPHP